MPMSPRLYSGGAQIREHLIENPPTPKAKTRRRLARQQNQGFGYSNIIVIWWGHFLEIAFDSRYRQPRFPWRLKAPA